MFAKLEITGTIYSKTGMHIGGSSAFAAIGAVDSPIIRDSLENLPMIPGSSLKGKMRSLLAKQYNDKVPTKLDDDDPRILRLFGSSKKDHIQCSRLLFSDMMMQNRGQLESMDVNPTEVKFENTINRLSAVANPRQIERAVRGAEYKLDLIYNVDNEEELVEDFETIRDGLKLLEYDYIGGHGSRGYGKIEFRDLDLDCVIGNIDDQLLSQCEAILNEI